MSERPRAKHSRKGKRKEKTRKEKHTSKEDDVVHVVDTKVEFADTTGSGRFEWANGAGYEGEWKIVNNTKRRHGFGVFVSGGEVYRGEWLDGVIHGRGQFEFSNGNTYNGEFVHSEFDGVGEYHWGDGSSYVGQWQANCMEGQGVYTTVSGDKYQGLFRNNAFINAEGNWVPNNEVVVPNVSLVSARTEPLDTVRTFKGNCSCGSIRVHVTTPLQNATVCHCSICRRQSGGPFVLYANAKADKVKFTGLGELVGYASGDSARKRALRYRCKGCGTPMAVYSPITKEYRIPLILFKFSANVIDRIIAPTAHEFYLDRALDVNDDLPKYKGFRDEEELLDEAAQEKKKKPKNTEKKRNADVIKGSCLCGNVQFVTEATPLKAGSVVCHCQSCQKFSGAPSVQYLVFDSSALQLNAEALTWHQTAEEATISARCNNCGSACGKIDQTAKLTYIPTQILSVAYTGPTLYHYNYAARILPVTDTVVKYQGAFGSQIFVPKKV